jgi:hypothetical protein
LANALHFHRNRKAAQNPPLDYTFFDKVSALKIPVPAELKAYANSMPGRNPFEIGPGHPPIRMEEFFKELFSDFQDAPPGSSIALAYEELVALYTRVLRETTDWIGSDKKTGGPVGRLLSAAADVSDTLTIVTFNHDLVIENEILKRARLRRRWCIERGYGTYSKSLSYTNPTSGLLFPAHSPTCDHARPIVVLKLHGSLNWFVRMNAEHPSRSILSGTAAAPRVHCTRRRNVPHQLRSTRPATTKAGRSRWYTWPVVIPPVYGKEAMTRNFVAQIWADAAVAVSTADRLIFVGYSLPVLDIGAERLFRRSVASNTKITSIDVVNPSPESALRYASVVTPTGVRWSYAIKSFLDAEPRL